jgi:hypothetical protein
MRLDARPITIATVYRCAQSELVPGQASVAVGTRLIINEDGHVTHDEVSGRMAAMLEAGMSSLSPEGLTSSACIEVDGVAAAVFVEALPFRLIPHRHRPRAKLQPAHELQVDMLR